MLVGDAVGVAVGSRAVALGGWGDTAAATAASSDMLAIAWSAAVGVAKLAAGRLCGRRDVATTSPASSATPKTTP